MAPVCLSRLLSRIQKVRVDPFFSANRNLPTTGGDALVVPQVPETEPGIPVLSMRTEMWNTGL
jgi:hypothetical protein